MAKKDTMKAPVDAVKPTMNTAAPVTQMSSTPKAPVQDNPASAALKQKK